MDRKAQEKNTNFQKIYIFNHFLLLGRTQNKIGLGPTQIKHKLPLYWAGLNPTAWTGLMTNPMVSN
jgi:hypothetical protein